MEEILKKLMTSKCISMHDPNYRCYGKECTGQCALFQKTLIDLEDMHKHLTKIGE